MLQSRVIKRTALIDHLKRELSGKESHFFADTSFLLAAASLNSTARQELARWLIGLGSRFHVPAWVAHEAYGKITAALELFTPMAKVANDAITAIEALQTEARRYIDNDRANGFFGQPDRVGFLADLDRVAKPLADRAKFLKGAKKTGEGATEFLVDLINRSVMPSDIYSKLSELDAEYAARVIGGHPPGFMDKGKAERTRQGDNRYGDLIIWREIIEFARLNPLTGVVLLTNDNKQDWVFVPPSIIDEHGHPLSNETRKGFKIILPLPLLCHELRCARENAELTIANLGMIAQMLHPELGIDAANLFSAYQLVAPVAPDPAATDEGEETDAAAAPLEPPPAAPALPSNDLTTLLTNLSSRDSDAAGSAAVAIRPLLGEASATPNIPLIAHGLVAAAERSIEASAILIRDIVTNRLELDEGARTNLIGAMLMALYYDEAGHLRNRPLAAALPELFGVQGTPTLRNSVEALNARLGPSRRFFLLTPDPSVPTLSLSLSTEREEPGDQRLRGSSVEEVSLMEDVARGSERALTTICGGMARANGGELRRALGAYFRVPEAQLDLGISRFETVGWDDLTGLIDWGADTGLQLR
jgi:hypothetical protein